MAKGKCAFCGKIVLEDVDEYKEKYPDETEIMCSNCGGIMRLK